MVGGGVHQLPPDFEAEHYIERGFLNSECRVPIVVVKSDGDPFMSVVKLARDRGCAVWTIETTNSKNEQNAIDYIDVGLQNGDWVYLSSIETCSQETLRQIATTLVTLEPDPKHFPRRELFRLWLAVDKPLDINQNVDPLLPQLLAQHSIVVRKGRVVPGGNDGGSPEKWVKRLPQEPPLFEEAVMKHAARRDKGRESDSESDTEEPGTSKVVGKWFHRAVDFHLADAGSTITKASEEIFRKVEADDGEGVAELCRAGQINLQRLRHKPTGMNLLQYACSLEKVHAARALLEAGADPNIPRESDGCPVLFMSLESQELVQSLIDFGANYEARYEGYTLERHPLTCPQIAKLIKHLKGY